MSSPAGREIRFASDGDEVGGYLAVPAGGSGPGVLVIQEWWGLVDHIRDVCDRFARDGFVALAPDLYRGERATDPDAAGRLMMDLEMPRAARDLDAGGCALLGERRPPARRRRGRLLHGRPARALRRHPEPPDRRRGRLLRHPPERDARPLRASQARRARHLRGAGRLRAARGRAQARGRAERRRQARPASSPTPASATPSSTTRARRLRRAAAERAWGMMVSFLRAELVA